MILKPNFLYAWLFQTVVFGLHVLDEALNDFLSFYNPSVKLIDQRFGIAFPVFEFNDWLFMLITAIAILFGLSFFVYQKRKWISYFAYFYAVIMILNGIGHVLFSLFNQQLIAGVYSSPLLLISGVYLVWSVPKGKLK